jgi:hypothetical protein
MCGSLLRFTGEYIDWDSGASFCGIFQAKFQARDSTATAMTAPNGRFDLCLPNQPTALVDVTPPTASTRCSMPEGNYELPGLAVANKAVIAAGGSWSGRAFVSMRQTVPPDPAKAQVFVHVNGNPREVSLEAAHGDAQARVNGTWGLGSTGSDVFFPDVAPGAGTTILTAGGALGTGSIPLEAGKMTSVSIISN